jgi:hypothetical protein
MITSGLKIMPVSENSFFYKKSVPLLDIIKLIANFFIFFPPFLPLKGHFNVNIGGLTTQSILIWI